MGGRERFSVVSADGTRIVAERRPGPGPAVVLVHGVAMDRRVWTDSGFLAALPADADVIAVDLRGRGESGPGHTGEGHAPDRYTADLRAVLDHVGREDCTLVGLYFGGRVALWTAAEDPRVARAVSFCAHAEEVVIPVEAVEEEARAVEGPDGHAYLRENFLAKGAPAWMVEACDRVDRRELGAATRGLLHGAERAAERGTRDQELVLVTASGDQDLDPFLAGAKRLGARLLLLDAPTRVRAAALVTEVARDLFPGPGADTDTDTATGTGTGTGTATRTSAGTGTVGGAGPA
ncbi:alpha/beta fold hydrolase [Streptomyces sp. NPDC015130]|uniref:alpha/beta fold hydrolase n=1 Tax=Streptomyces sp. NPDC015130 TaxID=3364940 RepID=UPI0036FF908F